MNKKQLLILTAIHGDEGFSIPTIKSLSKKYKFDWIICNPNALKKNRRFIDTDLNRSAPGNLKSGSYEERLAYKIIDQTVLYKEVIDIHGSVSKTGIFIIVTNPSWENIEFAKKFDIDNVVLWPGLKDTGPLTQFIPNSLEIECGSKNDKKITGQLNKILDKFLNREFRKEKQNIFIVTDILASPVKVKMKDFVETKYKGKEFYPLLVDQYNGIKCYMMQKLNNV